MDKKYKLTNGTIKVNGHTLHHIKALRDFGNVKKGELGGFIESEGNLSQDGLCWVAGNARVCGNAIVSNDARVCGNAIVFGNAKVCGNAEVADYAIVFGNAKVCGNARVYGHAEVCGNAAIGTFARITSPNDYIVIGPLGSRNAYTTVYRISNTDNQPCSSDLRIQCGCFNGTPDEFFAKVDERHKKGSIYHTQYTTIIKFMIDTMCQTSIQNITDNGVIKWVKKLIKLLKNL